MSEKRKAAHYGRLLKHLFTEWNKVLKKGSSDHEVTDGFTLNRIRDEIMCTMKEIAEKLPDGEYPEDFYAPVPDLMPSDYMADPEGIKENAKALYERISKCREWNWLLEWEGEIAENIKLKTDFYCLKGMVEKLALAISEDNLLVMKQYDDPDNLVVMILNCQSQTEYLHHKKEKAAKKESRDGWEQMNLEDWIA